MSDVPSWLNEENINTATTVSQNPAVQKAAANPSVQKAAVNAAIIGKRLPHYWLFALREEGGAVLPVSTIDLPQLIWQTVKINTIQPIVVPPYILLVCESESGLLDERMMKDFSADKVKEVVVVKIRKSFDQASIRQEKDEISHQDLQSIFQIPQLSLEENPASSYDFHRSLVEKKEEIDGVSQSWWTSIAMSLNGKGLPVKLRKVQDLLSIELNDVVLTSNTLNPNHKSPSYSKEIGLYRDLLIGRHLSGILVRPDGHIETIYSKERR